MTNDAPIVIDANILAYSISPSSPFWNASKEMLSGFQAAGKPLCISPQILREFLAITTKRSAAYPGITLDSACLLARRLLVQMKLLAETHPVADRLVTLLGERPLTGKRIHDANIVATMLTHGMRQLATNDRHFDLFTDLIEIVYL